MILQRPGCSCRDGPASGDHLSAGQHLTTDSSEDRPSRRNFEEADLTISDDLDISEASDIADRYLKSLDRLRRPRAKDRRSIAQPVLLTALFSHSPHHRTSLSEIFLQIRRQLLADGRELVLLVEDFAVLSGIQGALLGCDDPAKVCEAASMPA